MSDEQVRVELNGDDYILSVVAIVPVSHSHGRMDTRTCTIPIEHIDEFFDELVIQCPMRYRV